MTRRQKNKSLDRTHPSLDSVLNKLQDGEYGHEIEPTIDFLVQLICAYEIRLQQAEDLLKDASIKLSNTYK